MAGESTVFKWRDFMLTAPPGILAAKVLMAVVMLARACLLVIPVWATFIILQPKTPII